MSPGPGLSSLPPEVLEKILSHLNDPVSLARAEAVNDVWRDIILGLEKRGVIKRTRRIIKRLRTTESLNEALAIKESKCHAFKEGSVLAERAEKVFLSHMEIIRLKYPGSLARLRNEAHHVGLFVLSSAATAAPAAPCSPYRAATAATTDR